MAINPDLVTTAQVSELPPAPLSATSLLAHQVGDILSRVSMEELLLYVRSQSISQPYETKFLTIPQSEAVEYVSTNFDMTPGENEGIGKADGLWNGWAIHNGNNGTYNLDGQALIGFGATYNTIGQFVGSATHTLSSSELPSHRHPNGMADDTDDLFVYGSTNIGVPGEATRTIVAEDTPRNFQGLTGLTGGGQAHNNIQPSMVCLMIYKLP